MTRYYAKFKGTSYKMWHQIIAKDEMEAKSFMVQNSNKRYGDVSIQTKKPKGKISEFVIKKHKK